MTKSQGTLLSRLFDNPTQLQGAEWIAGRNLVKLGMLEKTHPVPVLSAAGRYHIRMTRRLVEVLGGENPYGSLVGGGKFPKGMGETQRKRLRTQANAGSRTEVTNSRSLVLSNFGPTRKGWPDFFLTQGFGESRARSAYRALPGIRD